MKIKILIVIIIIIISLEYSWQHFKEQSCWDQQVSSSEPLKSEAVCCVLMTGLKFPALTYPPRGIQHKNHNNKRAAKLELCHTEY